MEVCTYTILKYIEHECIKEYQSNPSPSFHVKSRGEKISSFHFKSWRKKSPKKSKIELCLMKKLLKHEKITKTEIKINFGAFLA